jgi:hypothetical protein
MIQFTRFKTGTLAIHSKTWKDRRKDSRADQPGQSDEQAGQSGEQACELLGSPNLWRGRRFMPITRPEGSIAGRGFALCES